MPGDATLADLVAAIDGFASAWRPAAEGVHLVVLRAAMDRLELAFSAGAAAFAATDEYETQGATSPVQWVRHNCKMTGAAAAEKVCVGEQLHRLPHLVESMWAGKIGFGHVAHAARTARALDESPTSHGFDDSDLLEAAEGMSVGKFGYACRHYQHARDPRGVVADEVAEAEMREASISTGPDGRVYLKADLDPEGGAIVRTALESLARTSGADDDRPYGRRMCDALVEGLLHTMQTGATPQRGGQRVHLQVTASVDTLKGSLGAPAADVEFSLPLSAEKARRWACDCSLTRILLNADSIPIDVGREKRIVPPATRKAVNLRYPCCAFEGCDRTASWTETHHIVHWIDGGPTIVENIVPLCFRHHFLVHEGGWSIVKTDSGPVFVPPPGNRLRRVRRPNNFQLV